MLFKIIKNNAKKYIFNFIIFNNINNLLKNPNIGGIPIAENKNIKKKHSPFQAPELALCAPVATFQLLIRFNK